MAKVILPILGLLLLAACNDSGSSAPTPRSSVVPMDTQAWAILYLPGMPAHPSPLEMGGWFFDFPSAPGSVHYVTAASNMTAVKHVSASIEVTTTGTPTFEYTLDANNTCINPARVQFLLQEKGDDLSGAGGKQYYRWWSINATYPLVAVAFMVTVFVRAKEPQGLP